MKVTYNESVELIASTVVLISSPAGSDLMSGIYLRKVSSGRV